jgi:hypothetical protein
MWNGTNYCEKAGLKIGKSKRNILVLSKTATPSGGRRNLAAFLRFKGRVAAVAAKAGGRHPVCIIFANLLQIKENRKLKFILPMLYYIDG